MHPETIYLITGASRGLGRGFLDVLRQRPNTTVVAAVRNLESSSSKEINLLSTASGSKVITVVIDSTVASSAQEAVKTLQSEHGITKLDVVIANAGIAKYYGLAEVTPIEEVREHFEVNTIGVLALFHATWPLLKLSSHPIFVGLTTSGASITNLGDIPMGITSYGISKAALNYLVRKIHFENPSLIAFVISPGWVQTEMGNYGASTLDMASAPLTIEDSVHGMLAKIDNATREETSGKFESFDDAVLQW
ncbi:aflatoxin biosynthesis ketoreductase nor-1-like protein [Coleophoma cylindrospora]|uniref:Aflatoxin biosynthesis ketoreductase nor-1-like protein n=1 Tax=Coleophoma cylindrospora TaxID=1849047 RepID=A0A3D8Q8W5_9HELO|nr:aflatoxin biosynthesis ketoreductase nor-1-like protein [Coleophoma cylindrospora]